MRMIRTLTAAAVLVAAGIGLAPRKAEALICCSACADNPRIAPCRHGCSPSCRAEDWQETLRLIYDDQLGLCYIGQ
jgi:hypothetical protein